MDDKVVPLRRVPDAIELRHLRAFVAVAEELNFGRAATRLYLSAPALSRQVRALERLIGAELLRRTTHRVELTVAGEALLDCARKLLLDLDKGIAATQAVGGELAERMARIWAPMFDYSSPDTDLQDVRNACESLHAQFAPPPEIGVRPVNAGGVPSFVLTPDDRAQPTMLYLHGGAFVMGSAFGYRPLADALAAAAETSVLIPEFRLAPEHPFPASLEDAMRAYLWILDSGVPAEQVTVAGDSSGGALTLSLMVSLKQQDLPLPGGAVLLCPVVDMSGETIELAETDGPQLVNTEQARRFINLYLAGHPLDDPLVSPLAADLTGLPPLLIQAATGDFAIGDAHRLTDHAQAHSVDVQLELYPVDTHAFHVFWSFLPEAADALNQAGRFAGSIRAGAVRVAGEHGRTGGGTSVREGVD